MTRRPAKFCKSCVSNRVVANACCARYIVSCSPAIGQHICPPHPSSKALKQAKQCCLKTFWAVGRGDFHALKSLQEPWGSTDPNVPVSLSPPPSGSAFTHRVHSISMLLCKKCHTAFWAWCLAAGKGSRRPVQREHVCRCSASAIDTPLFDSITASCFPAQSRLANVLGRCTHSLCCAYTAASAVLLLLGGGCGSVLSREGSRESTQHQLAATVGVLHLHSSLCSTHPAARQDASLPEGSGFRI